MKLINRTRYSKADLRRFFAAGIKAMGASTDKCIMVFYRGKRKRSRAEYPFADGEGYHVWMVLPRENADGSLPQSELPRLACVFEHEIAHTLGVRHAEMDYESKYATGDLPTWAQGLTIAAKPSPAAPTPTDRARAREAHARKMLERAQHRLKISQACVQRWRRKVSYYDRKTAASQVSPEVKP
jgi:hypothetical protein